ncbi:hypothetical protein LFX25_20760, partial [Leptospira sp. FAT2]|uniref:hypothetical protein n=1 Tax=Leptospira sanjuanensis TaxID=2879643 RepID=UPI001EE7D27A
SFDPNPVSFIPSFYSVDEFYRNVIKFTMAEKECVRFWIFIENTSEVPISSISISMNIAVSNKFYIYDFSDYPRQPARFSDLDNVMIDYSTMMVVFTLKNAPLPIQLLPILKCFCLVKKNGQKILLLSVLLKILLFMLKQQLWGNK